MVLHVHIILAPQTSGAPIQTVNACVSPFDPTVKLFIYFFSVYLKSDGWHSRQIPRSVFLTLNVPQWLGN